MKCNPRPRSYTIFDCALVKVNETEIESALLVLY